MKNTTVNDEVEIDLQRLFRALLKRSWLIGLSAVICAVAVFLGTYFFVTPEYQATAKFYVNNSSLSSLSNLDLSSSISSGDISASRGLVKTYIVILNTRETLNDVADYAGVDYSYSQIKRMISAQAVDSTEVFEVVVTSTDPQEAEKMANAVAYILPNRIKGIVDGTSAKVVEAAVVPSAASSPNYPKNVALGFLAGLVVMVAIVCIWELMDVVIRSEDELTRYEHIPVLTQVPDMMAHSGAGSYYGYGYGKKKPDTKAGTKDQKPAVLLGEKISFSAAEAYKLLRTKLQFSFAGESSCRVVGVSSAMAHEGKSLTAINLSHSLSQLGKRVLLIDCDLRRPSVAEKLPLKSEPGLSDYLTGQSQGDGLIQMCGLKEDKRAFHVISSGRIPPNPMELLSSLRIERMLEKLKDNYDYIILDLPPIGEVGDALVAAKLTDGMLLVVRQNYCDRNALNYAVNQLEFVNAKILGTVFNCTTESGSGYGYGYRYNRRYYGRKYGGKYYNREQGSPDPRAEAGRSQETKRKEAK